MRRTARLLTRLAVGVALTGLVAGCGAEGPDVRPDTLEAAAQAHSDTFLTGDEDAWTWLSQRCHDVIGEEEFGMRLKIAKALYGTPIRFTSFAASFKGATAAVTYTYASLPSINQTDEPWVFEDGAWRNDDCPPSRLK